MLGAISRRVPRTDTAKIKVKTEDRLKKVNESERTFNCTYCGQPLEGKDRSSYMLLSRLGSAPDPPSGPLRTMLDVKSYNSLHEASKDTGISLNALWNAREKGNKVPFEIGWSNIHPSCFEAKKERRRLEERERRIEEELERKRMLSKMTEEELAEFERVEEEERNRRDIEFEKRFERLLGKSDH